MPTSTPPPPFTRGPGRPVRRRTRSFRPNYLSFAGTYQCNLACPHCCVPIEWPDRLDIGLALRFLEDAHAYGIGILGFTGGEPFLYAEFVHTLCRRAAKLGFHFDKIVTNGLRASDAEFDPVKRAADVNRADTEQARVVSTIPLYMKPTFFFYKKTLHGVIDNPTNQGPTWNAEDWTVG